MRDDKEKDAPLLTQMDGNVRQCPKSRMHTSKIKRAEISKIRELTFSLHPNFTSP